MLAYTLVLGYMENTMLQVSADTKFIRPDQEQHRRCEVCQRSKEYLVEPDKRDTRRHYHDCLTYHASSEDFKIKVRRTMTEKQTPFSETCCQHKCMMT